ncbi:MAG: NAD(P)H-dependent glycerol-3-phosphate dehydrogenase [Bacteroidales bacterium]|nr:NAD(P)H-dependent glycerol-3-phosphate dehydrogenase [Bacteroidales bacterium]
MNISVLGSGSWATAIVKIATQNHDKVYWWVRETEIVEGVRQYGRNPLFLRSCQLDTNKIEITTDIKKVISATDNIVLVIPSAFVEKSLQDLTPSDFENKIIISATKGIIPSTNQIVADYLQTQFKVELDKQAVLSGPSHAEEIAQDGMTYLTLGAHQENLAQELANRFACRFVKTRTSNDVRGIEYSAVLKNIYALVAGICKGAGYGDNFIAVLISNAAQEMQRFLNVIAQSENRDTNNFVYLGDLLVTAYSQHSRNRTFGQMIGQGYTVKSAQLEMSMVAEGYYATDCINKTNAIVGVNMPIANFAYKVLYEGASLTQELRILSETFK